MRDQGYPAPNRTPDGIYVLGLERPGRQQRERSSRSRTTSPAQAKYRDGVFAALDYLLGPQPARTSPTSRATASRPVRNVHHRFWAQPGDASLPIAPPGVALRRPEQRAAGPDRRGAGSPGCQPQKCFVDHIEAYSVNEVTVNWNSALAWLASWAAEHAGSTPTVDTTPPSTPGTPTASAVGRDVRDADLVTVDGRGERDRAVRDRPRRRGGAPDHRDVDHDVRHRHGPDCRHGVQVPRPGAQRRPAVLDVLAGRGDDHRRGPGRPGAHHPRHPGRLEHHPDGGDADVVGRHRRQGRGRVRRAARPERHLHGGGVVDHDVERPHGTQRRHGLRVRGPGQGHRRTALVGVDHASPSGRCPPSPHRPAAAR